MASFRKQFGTQYGRSGSASAVANAGVPCELVGAARGLTLEEGTRGVHEVQCRFSSSCVEGGHEAAQWFGARRSEQGGSRRSPLGSAGDRFGPVGAENPLEKNEDVRSAKESAGARPLVVGEDLPPDVVGVPPGAFLWS